MKNDSEGQQVLVERSLPRVSIRLAMLLITASAIVMWMIRGAMAGNWFWAQCLTVVLIAMGACFAAYAFLFALASLFASLTGAILSVGGNNPGDDSDQERGERD